MLLSGKYGNYNCYCQNSEWTISGNHEDSARVPGRQTDLPRPGAIPVGSGTVEWNVWAPHAPSVDLILDPDGESECYSMQQTGEWFRLQNNDVRDGTRYRFRLPAGDFPDPASRWQPEGVFGPSAVFFANHYPWTSLNWTGIPREELVIYELHVGTFTAEGTFTALIDRLDDLKSLGITAIELMPVGQFPGERNWGYDGVQHYAVQNSYGGPYELQRLVDQAHQTGLAVILDVVYNHLGPEGNFLSQFGPYFTKAYQTPWGDAINYDGPKSDPVRQYVIENACMWIRDFRLDGLRLDAVHAIYDFSAFHLLAEMQQAIQQIAHEQGRFVHLIAESDQNDPRLIDSLDQHGFGLDAVWTDDFHHCLHTLLTGEQQGYYRDFGSIEQLAKAYENVFVYDGIYSIYRHRRHGMPVKNRDRSHFVVCVQNHDQIGNRRQGDRLSTSLPSAAQRLACGLLLISPCIPLIFMGTEYGERNPFPFFCSFVNHDLTEAIRQGRRAEFKNLELQWGASQPVGSDNIQSDFNIPQTLHNTKNHNAYDVDNMEIPDPGVPETFLSAKLSWSWPKGTFSARLRQLYHDLLQARREWPELRNRSRTTAIVCQETQKKQGSSPVLLIERGNPESLVILANLSACLQPFPEISVGKRTVRFSTEEERYDGTRRQMKEISSLLPYELLIYGQNYE